MICLAGNGMCLTHKVVFILFQIAYILSIKVPAYGFRLNLYLITETLIILGFKSILEFQW